MFSPFSTINFSSCSIFYTNLIFPIQFPLSLLPLFTSFYILANKPLIPERTKIHKAKAEKARERILKEEMDAKRAKTKAARERRQERITTKRTAMLGGDEEEESKKE